MAKFIKTNITKNVDYTDSHCTHYVKDSEGHITSEKEHENHKIAINISGNTGIFVGPNNDEIATTDCKITETCPEGDVVNSDIPIDNLNLQSNTNIIVSDGFKTHTGETFNFDTNEYVSVNNINIGSNVLSGPNVHIGTK